MSLAIASLRGYLLEHKSAFVAELSRLNSGASLELVPETALTSGGYLFVPAEANTADWSFARLIISPKNALESISLLPNIELQLLIPIKWADVFSKTPLKKEPHLLAFTSENIVKVPSNPMPRGYELKIKESDNDFFAVRSFYNGRLVASLSVIYSACGHIEAAVETEPAHQNKGLASAMLSALLNKAHSRGVIVHYNVEENNFASLRVAEKCALRRAKELDLARFIKP